MVAACELLFSVDAHWQADAVEARVVDYVMISLRWPYLYVDFTQARAGIFLVLSLGTWRRS
jgi:hypothetical protein